jgi:hypothetical protein
MILAGPTTETTTKLTTTPFTITTSMYKIFRKKNKEIALSLLFNSLSPLLEYGNRSLFPN